MDEKIKHALETDKVIDITATGCKSGLPRRTEIWFHNVGGRLFITGRPGPRSWYANLVANPDFTFHLKESLQADLPAKAVPLTEGEDRREIITEIHRRVNASGTLESWVESSPLIEVFLQEE